MLISVRNRSEFSEGVVGSGNSMAALAGHHNSFLIGLPDFQSFRLLLIPPLAPFLVKEQFCIGIFGSELAKAFSVC